MMTTYYIVRCSTKDILDLQKYFRRNDMILCMMMYTCMRMHDEMMSDGWLVNIIASYIISIMT
jgi:hypothetical protein